MWLLGTEPHPNFRHLPDCTLRMMCDVNPQRLTHLIKQEEPLKIECQHFLDCIRQGLTPLTNGEQGLKLVKILEAASSSLKRNGASVNLNLTSRETSETSAWAPPPAPAPQIAQAEAVRV